MSQFLEPLVERMDESARALQVLVVTPDPDAAAAAAASAVRLAAGRDIQVLTADRVVKDSPRVYGGWIIHRANFRAPKILDVARLQAWTLKPALRAAPSEHSAG